jgi:hypothetical protein
LKFLTFLLLLAIPAQAADEARLRAALDAHNWFELRDAVVSGGAPRLYRFFVAVAFNDVRGGEGELRAAIRSGTSREQLASMHHAMYRLYSRIGRYRKATLALRRCWALDPDRASTDPAVTADVAAMEHLPDLKLVSRRPATVAYTNWAESPRVVSPMTINGQTVQFALDTDASMSGTSEAEAKRLGLRPTPGQPLYDAMTGGRSTKGHYAVADRLKIGNTELRDVSFLVLPDDNVFAEVPLGQQGAVGLPVLLALQTVRWNRNHELNIGFPPGRVDLRNSNLAFEELDPMVLVEVGGRRVAVDLDTGSNFSHMWPLFVKNFPELLQDGQQDKAHMSGVAGDAEVDSVMLPELLMKVAGFPIVLRNVHALRRSTIPASEWHYGLLGMDQLAQATEVTLDFKEMRLQLK